MNRVLAAGLPVELGAWLEKRLGQSMFRPTISGLEALSELATGSYSMLIVDDRLAGFADVMNRARESSKPLTVTVACYLDKSAPADVPRQLVTDYAVDHLLFHPLDGEDVAQHIAATLGISLDETRGPEDDAQLEIMAAIASVWEQFRETMMNGLDVVDRAIALLREGDLDHELRRQARAEAHKLAGSVGTCGFADGTRQAREIERLLQGGEPLTDTDISRLAQLSRSLRHELTRLPSPGTPRLSADPILEDRTSRLLIVDCDRKFGEQLAEEAAVRGINSRLVADIAAARWEVLRERPDSVVLDPAFPEGTVESLALLATLTNDEPPVPVLVLTGRDTFIDRTEVTRLASQGYFQKPMAAAKVLDGVTQSLQRSRAAKAKVLVVDDDPQVLATLRALLTSPTVRVATIDDPLRFWETLEEMVPDLVILDFEMPHITGIELCRLTRNEPRWHTLPVVFLTAHTDPNIVHRIFAAGADDYVSKPIVGPELVTRIRNRLERTQLQRQLAETDALTGLANRYKASQMLNNFLRLGERDREPICFAVVDVDRFKQVNDRHGHLAGDEVLRRLGQLLTYRFRSDDVVARWGGEEFVLGMYGTTRENGVRRLTQMLDAFRQERFHGDDDVAFQVTFSAGVSIFPADGRTVSVLFRAADAALYRAKEVGRNQVLSTEELAPRGNVA